MVLANPIHNRHASLGVGTALFMILVCVVAVVHNRHASLGVGTALFMVFLIL
jgi:branched-subunit amino acid transport protein AzlD